MFDRNDPELKNKLDRFICNILEPVADKLGWSAESGEDPHRSQLRGLILGSLSKAEHSKTIEQALKLYDEYSNGRCTLHPDLRPIVSVKYSAVFTSISRSLPLLFATMTQVLNKC